MTKSLWLCGALIAVMSACGKSSHDGDDAIAGRGGSAAAGTGGSQAGSSGTAGTVSGASGRAGVAGASGASSGTAGTASGSSGSAGTAGQEEGGAAGGENLAGGEGGQSGSGTPGGAAGSAEGGASGAGAQPCGESTCGADEVCIAYRTVGGALLLPDEDGNCPEGSYSSGGSAAHCIREWAYECRELEGCERDAIDCDCGRGMCPSGHDSCHEAGAGDEHLSSDAVLTCELLAP